MPIKKIWIIIPVMFLIFVPEAFSSDEIKPDILNELYTKSGMEKQNRELPSILQIGFEQGMRIDSSSAKLNPATASEISKSIAASFSPDDLKKDVLDVFRGQLTDKDIEAILKWLDSPTGKKCTQLEEDANSPYNISKREEYEASLKDAPPDQKRLDLARKLNQATNAVESSLAIAINMQMAIMTAINLSLPVEKQMPFTKMKQDIAESRPKMKELLEPQVLVGTLFTYRSLSEEELNAYIDFLSTKTGKKYTAAATEGLKKALENGSVRWGKAIADILNSEGKSSDA
jgi:hypothetical protein